MRETKIEKALVIGVKNKDGLCLKFVSPGRRGVPDRIVVTRYGEIIFVELKAPQGKLTQWQIRCHNELRDRDAHIEVIWTLEQVAEFLIYDRLL